MIFEVAETYSPRNTATYSWWRFWKKKDSREKTYISALNTSIIASRAARISMLLGYWVKETSLQARIYSMTCFEKLVHCAVANSINFYLGTARVAEMKGKTYRWGKKKNFISIVDAESLTLLCWNVIVLSIIRFVMVCHFFINRHDSGKKSMIFWNTWIITSVWL